MLLTIDKIKELKQKGEKKWGKALADYLKPHFDNNDRLDAIQELLLNQYGIEMPLANLQKLKSIYYNKPKKINTLVEHKIISAVDNIINYTVKKEEQPPVIQNQDVSKTELENLYNDLMGDEDIVEKQKRENEELLLRNSKGPKWW